MARSDRADMSSVVGIDPGATGGPDMPLVPDGCRVERHGRADAALIALYGVGVLKKRGLV